jgi:hypothetical protein
MSPPLNCLTRSIRSKAKSYLCSLFNWTGRDMHEEEWYGSGRQSVKSLRPRPVNIPSSSRSGGTGHGKTETAGCRQKKWRIDDMHGKTSAGVARTPAKLLSVTCIRRPPLSCHCETRVPLLRVQYRTCLIMHVIFLKKHSTCSDDCVYLACRPGFMRSPSRGVVPWLPIFQFAGMTKKCTSMRWGRNSPSSHGIPNYGLGSWFMLLLLSFLKSCLVVIWIVGCLILGIDFCNIYLVFMCTKSLKSNF